MFSPKTKISCPAGTAPIKLKPAKKHANSEDSESKEGALIFSARLKFSSGGSDGSSGSGGSSGGCSSSGGASSSGGSSSGGGRAGSRCGVRGAVCGG